MEGWIKIHRKIKDHWLWKSDHRLKWWLDILLTVNHADTKILVKGNLIDCKRGQSIRSLDSWAKDWNVTKKTVKDFFELLQKDSMLVYESIQISTRITVCNYEDYQDTVNAKETKSKRRVNGEETETLPKQEGIRRITSTDQPIFNTFYDLEIKNNPDVLYLAFVKFLFGDNDLCRPLNKLLKMDDQIGYKQFLKLKERSEMYGIKIYETCRNLDNYTKKTYSSFYTTLYNWMKPKEQYSNVR